MIVSRRDLLLALAVFIVLTLAFSWPLAPHMRGQLAVAGPALDAMHLLYAVTWGSQALSDNPFHLFQATFFYPYSSSLAFMDHVFALSVLAAPVNWATGNMMMGFNVAWLLTFVLSGLGAFLLARYLTESTPAAILAGILFAFQPFRYHSLGQINVLAVMWIPFALLCLHLWVETRLRRQLFLFLAFSLAQFLSSAYSGVFLLLAAALYLGVLLVTERGPTLELLTRQRWVILAAATLGLVAAAPFVAPYLQNAVAGVGLDRSLQATAGYSAVPLDFLTPAPGSLLGRLVPWTGHGFRPLFPGVVALILAGTWVAARGWRRHPHRPEMIFYALLAPICGLLALGPTLGRSGHGLPLPFTALFYLFPGVAYLHAPIRFVIPATLGLAVLAAAGLVRLLGDEAHRLQPRRRLAAYGVAALAGIELFAAPVSLLTPLPRVIPPVYSWLGSVEGNLAIVELPMPLDENHESLDFARYQLYSLVHKKRLANGVASLVPPITAKLRDEMQHFPNHNSVAMLRELGITYALVHTDLYPPGEREELEAEIRAHPGLSVVMVEGPIWIIDVVPRGTAGVRLPG